MRIPRVLIILAGLVGIFFGLALTIGQAYGIYTMIQARGQAFLDANLYLLNKINLQAVPAVANVFSGLFSLSGGLTLLFPIFGGRNLHRLGNKIPDVEVVPKAYRDGGIELIVSGALVLAGHLLLVWLKVDDRPAISPFIIMSSGIVGVLASLSKNYRQ